MKTQNRSQKDLKLFDAEHKLMQLVWEREPIGSGELARLCLEKLGWQRTTVYTMLKKLSQRGVLQNQNAVVTSLVGREEIQLQEGRRLLERLFDNSLPGFVAAFVGEEKLSTQEAEQLKTLIDRCREEKGEG